MATELTLQAVPCAGPAQQQKSCRGEPCSCERASACRGGEVPTRGVSVLIAMA